jgi:hypothetical protein
MYLLRQTREEGVESASASDSTRASPKKENESQFNTVFISSLCNIVAGEHQTKEALAVRNKFAGKFQLLL